MLRLPRFFILPGTFTAAFLVGACNAVGATQERDRWFAEYLSKSDARNEAVEGFDKARALVKTHGRRVTKRAIVRLSREHRAWKRQARDRGDHIVGRGAAAELRDYRVWSFVPESVPEGIEHPQWLTTVAEDEARRKLYPAPGERVIRVIRRTEPQLRYIEVLRTWVSCGNVNGRQVFCSVVCRNCGHPPCPLCQPANWCCVVLDDDDMTSCCDGDCVYDAPPRFFNADGSIWLNEPHGGICDD